MEEWRKIASGFLEKSSFIRVLEIPYKTSQFEK